MRLRRGGVVVISNTGRKSFDWVEDSNYNPYMRMKEQMQGWSACVNHKVVFCSVRRAVVRKIPRPIHESVEWPLDRHYLGQVAGQFLASYCNVGQAQRWQ